MDSQQIVERLNLLDQLLRRNFNLIDKANSQSIYRQAMINFQRLSRIKKRIECLLEAITPQAARQD